MVTDPTTLAVYAALAENVYRRDSVNDQALSLDEISESTGIAIQRILAEAGVIVTDADGEELASRTDGAGQTQNDLAVDGDYYYSDRAFVGMIVQVGGKHVVVFRGTDTTLSGWSSVWKAAIDQALVANIPFDDDILRDLYREPYKETIDYEDSVTNNMLGGGTYRPTQWDDARALTERAIELAGRDNVVVVGQSLGGGLAALASVVLGVEGHVIAPAPFQRQLNNEANLKAADTIFADYASYFHSSYNSASRVYKAVIIEDIKKHHDNYSTVDNQIVIDFVRSFLREDQQAFAQEIIDATIATLNAVWAEFNDNISGTFNKLNSYLNVGETLSNNDTLMGQAFAAFSDHFKAPDYTYNLGEGPDAQTASELKHGSSLHALVMRTESLTGKKFSELLQGDEVLRSAFLGDIPIIGTMDHGREGPDGDPSKLLNPGPNSTIALRALWKEVGVTNGLYDYFYKLFSDTGKKGIAAVDPQSGSSLIHEGWGMLALGVFRDALKNSDTIEKFKINLGTNLSSVPTVNFAGGVAGLPPADRIVVDLRAIANIQEQHNGRYIYQEASGRPLGVARIDTAIWSEAKDSLSTATDSVQKAWQLHTIFGLPFGVFPSFSDSLGILDANGVKQLWEILVVQAGVDNGGIGTAASYWTPEAGHSLLNHALILGNGADYIASGDGHDFIIGNSGDDVLKGGAGNDLIVGGSGVDNLDGGAGDDKILGGAGDDQIKPSAGNDLVDGGDGIDTVDYSGQAGSIEFDLAAIFPTPGIYSAESRVSVKKSSDASEDTLYSVERIFGTSERDAAVLQGSLETLLSQLDGLEWIDFGDPANDSIDPVSGYRPDDEIDASSVADGIFANFISSDSQEIALRSNENLSVTFKNADSLKTGSGNDKINVVGQFRTIDSGAGHDTINVIDPVYVPATETTWEQYISIDGSSGNDTITVEGGFGAVVRGGTGNDYIFSSSYGSVLYGGEHQDMFEVTADVIIADAEPLDKLVLFGKYELTGGLAFGGEDTQWAQDSGFGFVRYGINVDGELVVSHPKGEMFVADYYGGNTAGIYVAQLKVYGWRPFDGPFPAEAMSIGESIEQIYKSTGDLPPEDPLVFDLDGDGIETTTLGLSNTYFDLDGDMFAEKTGWLRPDDGFLAMDRDGSGGIEDVSELFGAPGVSGFAELALHDSNGDGVIDAQDTDWGELMIWQDLDGDGTVDAGELSTLDALGITSIDLTATVLNQTLSTGHVLSSTASFTRIDPTTGLPVTGAAYDLIFESSQFKTRYIGDNGVAGWAASLPDAKGYGLFTDLAVAATNDMAVADLVETIPATMTTPDLTTLRAQVEPLMLAWADANPDSRELTPVLVSTDVNGETRVDYAVYQEDDGGVPGGPVTGYWTLESGGDVLATDGITVIARPTMEDVLAQGVAAGQEWRLQQTWSPDRMAVLADRPEAPYLASVDANGLVAVLDHGVYVEDAQGGYWTLASGADVLAADGITVIARPTLADVLAQAAGAGEEWRAESIAAPETPITIGDVAVVWFGTNVYDYSVWVDDPAGGYWASAKAVQTAAAQEATTVEGPTGATLQDYVDAYNVLNPIRPATILDGSILRYAAKTGGVDMTELTAIVAGVNGTTGAIEYDFAVTDINVFLRELTERYDYWKDGVAVRLAAQGGLSSYFTDVPYDAATDSFTPTSLRELIPLFEQIFANAPADQPGALDWLAGWSTVLNIVYADFKRNGAGAFSPSFVFANVVAAYESTGIATDIYDTAEKLGVPRSQIVFDNTEGATVNGTDGEDIFYVSTGNQTFQGGQGKDVYVIGKNFGQDVIYDLEPPLSNRGADSIRFADIASTEVTATREGIDLIITVDATGDTLRIVEEFEGKLPSLFGGDFSNDTGVAEIVFSDGVVWDKVDIAWAVSHPDPLDNILIGTPEIDVMDGGTGNDFLYGGIDSDIYIFNPGYGHDTIEDVNGNILIAHSDIIQFGAGIAKEDLIFNRVGNSDDLEITFANDLTGLDKITLEGQFEATNTWVFGVQWLRRVEYLSFSDFTAMSWEDVMKQVLLDEKTAGADNIYGFYYQDRLDGGAGDDFLSGSDEGDTYVFGRGYGTDTIEDAQTNVLTESYDRVELAADISPGDLQILRTGNSETITLNITGTTDNLVLQDQYSVVVTGVFGDFYFDRIEEIVFTDGSDTVWTHDYLRRRVLEEAKTDGDDTIYGFNTYDVLDGGAGNDTLAGGGYSDTYIFARGYGNDTIVEDGYNILIENQDQVLFQGLNYADVTVSRQGDDLIFTIIDSGETLTLQDQYKRWIIGGQFNAVENFVFQDVTISLLDLNPEDIPLIGTAGADTLTGTWFGETLDGQGGNDLLQGGVGGDTYIFDVGYGVDTVADFQSSVYFNGQDRVLFGPGVTTANIELAKVGDNLEITIAGNAADKLIIQDHFKAYYYSLEYLEFDDGTTWDNTRIKTELNLAAGTDGDDVINGFADIPNTLDGGLGDDTLNGGNYGDTYVFGLGYGSDVINEVTGGIGGAIDKVVFDATIAPESLSVTREGTDLILTLLDAGDTLRITDGLGSRQVEEFHFADATIWTLTDIQAKLIEGTDGADILIGYGSADVMDGGLGSDELQGGLGDDVYMFELGYGQDSVVDTGGYDAIDFGQYIVPEIVNVERDGDNLIFTIDGYDDNLVVIGGMGASAGRVEEFRFADGRVWTYDDVRERLLFDQVTDSDDVVTGYTDRADELTGGMGSDLISGLGGGDHYTFSKGDGSDIIDDSGAGTGDRLEIVGYSSTEATVRRVHEQRDDVRISFAGTADEITIIGGLNEASADAIEAIVFDDGITWTAADLRAQIFADAASSGNDVFYGFSSNDVMEGGLGEDVYYGRDGSDTYIFNRGDGFDLIDDNGSGDTDRLEIRGYTPEEISVQRYNGSSNDALLLFAGTDDRIVIRSGFTTDAADQIEQIAFDDGTTWSYADLRARLAAPVDYGGNDSITGFGGNDTLIGGLGDDWLSGGGSGDTYVFNRGDGKDVIDDNGTEYIGDPDRLEIKGYLPSEVTLSRGRFDKDALVINFAGTSDQITIVNTLDGDLYDEIQQIVFDDSTVWDMNAVKAGIVADASTAGNDYIEGYSSADTLTGGLGNDSLSGLGGNDTYVFARGDGSDWINDNGSGSDTLQLTGYTKAEVIFGRDRYNSNTLELTFTTSSDSVRIYNTLAGQTATQIETYVLDDGIWTAAEIAALVPAADPVSNIYGDGGANTLTSTAADENLFGKNGNDTYIYSRGGGKDQIEDDPTDISISGTDQLQIHGYTLEEISVSYSGRNTIFTFSGTDDELWLINDGLGEIYDRIETVKIYNNSVLLASWTPSDLQAVALSSAATSGDNNIYGYTGADTLTGGAGSDFLSGGEGNDTYVYNRGDGHDRIEDDVNLKISGTDVVKIQGYSLSEITVVRSGDSLIFTFAAEPGDRLELINAVNHAYDAIEQVDIVDDGTSWTTAQLSALALSQAGTAGDDSINGYSSADTMAGGLGEDYLSGGDGGDTYSFAAGDGHDTIDDNGNAGTDRLEISGYTYAEATIRRLEPGGGDLVIEFAGTEDRITILNTLGGSAADTIEQIVFVDEALTLTMADLLPQLAAAAATAGDDLIYGTALNDVLTGLGGADVMDGGAGADEYIYSRGDGDDRIEDIGSTGDFVSLIGYLPSEVSVDRSPPNGLDLILTFADGGRLVIASTLQDDAGGVESIVFDDDPVTPTVWTMADLRARIVAESGTTGDEFIWGFNSNDTLIGGTGDDVLIGGTGSDTYIFTKGDGVERINDNGGGTLDSLVIHGYAPGDVAVSRLYKASDDLVLTFAGTDDSITIMNTLAGDPTGVIESIVFDDATTWDMAQVEILLSNNAPVARRDSYFTAIQNLQTVIGASQLLANDYDPDGDSITVVAVKNPLHGAVSLDVNGNVLFMIDSSYSGITSFEYTISDGKNGLADATAYVRVIAPPTAVNDNVSTPEDTALTLTAAQLLFNDLDGDLLVLNAVSNPVNGTVQIVGEGDILFTPLADFNGSASIDYTATTAYGGLTTGTVFIDVTAVNDLPVAVADSGYTTAEDQAITITAGALLLNDSDIDGDTLTISGLPATLNGVAVFDVNGDIVFTPDADYYGPASFTYEISDGAGGTAQATVDITVTSVNDAPAPADDFGLAVAEDTALTILASDLLVNDIDIDGDPLTITQVLGPVNGAVELQVDGSILFTPDADFFGTGYFVYEVSDGVGGLAQATAYVDVTPVNDAPVATGETGVDAFTTAEDTVLSISAAALLANDYDIDGDILSILSVSSPINGAVVLEVDGSVTFTPDQDFWGTASFSYTISDGQGGVASAVAQVDVTPVNDAPTDIMLSNASVEENSETGTVVGSLLSTDPDAGDTATYTLVDDAGGRFQIVGSEIRTANGLLLDFETLASHNITVRATDSTGLTFDKVLTIALTDLNEIATVGNDVIYGTPGPDTIDGLDGDDTIYARSGDDILIGGLGIDSLYGAAGNDTLDGGAGDDLLDGGADVDTASYAGDTAGVNVDLTLGTAVGATTGSDTLVGIENVTGGAGADTLTGDGGDNVLDGGLGVDTVSYAGDTLGVTIDLTTGAASGAGIGSDTILGVENVIGGSGNDLVIGRAGNGQLDGGLGADEVSYAWTTLGVSVDLSTGVATGSEIGSDVLIGIENLIGGAGNDVLYGYGGTNILTGGAGNDSLSGRAGDDIYIYTPGGGSDTILRGSGGLLADQDVLEFAEGIAVADVTYSASGTSLVATVAGSGSITINDYFVFGRLTSLRFFDGTNLDFRDIVAAVSGQTDAANTINGSSGNDLMLGLGGNDTIKGNNGYDTLIGGLGNDNLQGGNFGDTYIYDLGDGDDYLFELAVTTFYNRHLGDKLVLGPGIAVEDVLVTRFSSDWDDVKLTFSGTSGSIYLDENLALGLYGIDEIHFADGTVWSVQQLINAGLAQAATAGNDYLVGGKGNDVINGYDGADVLRGWNGYDTLVGGGGNDDLQGGYHADTYVYNLGDGDDVIYDYSTTVSGWDLGDKLVLGAGITTANILITRYSSDWDDVLLTFSGSAGSILLNENLAQGGYGVEEIHFDDGTVWSQQALVNAGLAQAATTGNDYLLGGKGNDVINGYDGADVLRGWNGYDTLVGGGGNDDLQGGFHADTYVYNLGDGDDVVYDYSTTVSGWDLGDKLVLGPGIAPVDVMLTKSGNDVTMTFSGYSGSILLDQQMQTGGYGLEEFVFDDATMWTAAELASHLIIGTTGDDTLAGTQWGDYLEGGAGDDRLAGMAGPDFLIGGAGVDTADYGGSDAGVNVSLVTGAGTGGHAAGDVLTGIENLDGSIYADILTGDAATNLLNGGAGDDQVSGGAGDDLITGGAGADTLDGGDGFDTLDYSASLAGVTVDLSAGTVSGGDADGDVISGFENLTGSDFADMLTGDAGANALSGGDGDDILIGGSGGDVLDGGLGVDTAVYSGSDAGVTVDLATGTAAGGDATGDTLTGIENVNGSAFYDILTGDAGANALSGGSGADTLDGGAGNDMLTGGLDIDTFVFRDGSGEDTITDFTTGDIIDLSAFGFAGIGDLTISAGADPADTLIQLDVDDKVILLGVDSLTLTANDFMFA